MNKYCKTKNLTLQISYIKNVSDLLLADTLFFHEIVTNINELTLITTASLRCFAAIIRGWYCNKYKILCKSKCNVIQINRSILWQLDYIQRFIPLTQISQMSYMF